MTSGCTIASILRSTVPEMSAIMAALSTARSTAPSTTASGKASPMGVTADPPLAVEAVYLEVGVEDWEAQAGEVLGDGRLAHADGAGQAHLQGTPRAVHHHACARPDTADTDTAETAETAETATETAADTERRNEQAGQEGPEVALQVH
eukprot:CAMPEP_0173199070 /NCGR_PEP_ID=MMETSP1141-20130122/17030_1 /TAXON_ID=483371 /ORGANISM="non described non described, Strain CCMP2298" /LENGTH=148 /DNA_ID=CAMNT_0014123917 /DNA_START=1318 /DNA_END=1763 /DNA_ORIENTATION=+